MKQKYPSTHLAHGPLAFVMALFSLHTFKKALKLAFFGCCAKND